MTGNKSVIASKDYVDTTVPQGVIGNINSPLLALPLNNGLAMKQGTGSVTFTRSTTATYIDRYGVLQYAEINEPRFEKDGLLIEGESTNVCTYSQDFSNEAWVKNHAGNGTDPVVTSNYGVSPDGTTSADRLVMSITDDTSSDNQSYIDNVISNSFTNPSTRTLSIWLKSNNGAEQILGLRDYTDTEAILYATVTTEWQRFELTKTNTASENGRILIFTRGNYGNTSKDIDVLVYGAQYEELPFASSYIPTTDCAVTRGRDNCEITFNGNAVNFDSPSTWMGDFTVGHIGIPTLKNRGMLGIVNEEFRYIRFNNNGTNMGASRFGGYDISAYTSDKTFRWASVDNGTGAQGYVDGVISGGVSDTLVTTIGVRSIKLCNTGHATEDILFGHIKNFRIYDRALTPQEIKLA